MTFDPATMDGPALAGTGFEESVASTGQDLSDAFNDVLDGIHGGPHGPQNLARTLGLDKVLTSRLLKAVRNHDPVAVVHHIPGPEPLRRLLRAARKRGADNNAITAGEDAVERFEKLIRQEAGDRSSLGAIISAWLPEAREEFELRRKQSAYKAMSQLKGVSAEMSFSAAFLHPSETDDERVDTAWLLGTFGLQRLRPNVEAKFATRKLDSAHRARHPLSIAGESAEALDHQRLDQFCFAPPAPLEVERVGECVHYMLGESGFGPKSAVDVILAEVNRGELSRCVEQEAGRRDWYYADIATPCKRMQFDVFVHRDLCAGSEPELFVYDTAINGIADVNDCSRDADRLDTAEKIQAIGHGVGKLRTAEIPNYVELIRHVFGQLGWNADEYRGYRCRIEYPIYGSQVCMAFGAPH